MRCLATLLCLFLLTSCSREQLIQKISSPEDQAIARAYIEQLRAHQFDEIEKAADSSIKSSTIHATLVRMSQMIPAGEPTSVKVVGARSFYGSGATTINTTFEFNLDGKLLLINVAVKTKDGVKSIVGFNVNPERRERGRADPIQPGGQEPAAVHGSGGDGLQRCCAQFMRSFFASARNSRQEVAVDTVHPLRHRSGNGKLDYRQWVSQIRVVAVVRAGVLKDASGPWMVSASVPLGALVFLGYRKMLLR